MEVDSADGSLHAVDIVPRLAEMAAESAAHAAGPAWRSDWPEPVALWESLDAVAWECLTGPWARHVASEVRRLGKAASRESAGEALCCVAKLQAFAKLAEVLGAQLDQREEELLAAKLRQAERALTRRLLVWKQVLKAGGLSTPVHDPATANTTRLSRCLAQVRKLEGDPAIVQGWWQYLALEPVEQALADSAADPQARRAAAAKSLVRMTRPGLAADQRQFLQSEAMVELGAELRRHAAGPIDLGQVLQHVEQYEHSGAPSRGQAVAEDVLLLRLSDDRDLRELGEMLQSHYRGPNLRIALTKDLLERLLPEREPEVQWVHDRVMGRPVHGRSVTSAEVGLRLIPDPRRLRLSLEIEGLVSALTESTAGPATFWNDSRSTYRATKEVEIGASGLLLHPAEVTVDNDTRLHSLRTDLDPIPLLGAVAQEIAQAQVEKSRPMIRQEVQRKVAAQAKRQIDEEVDSRLRQLDAGLQSRVLGPLAAMWLGLTMVEARTTERRLTAELRLAGDDQLAGHTVRPWAPSDSLASCQVHESALNNVVQRIGLDGRTFTLPEVRRRFAEAFHSPELPQQDPDREDVVITFADRDAMCIRCRDGRVGVTLSIARLEKSPNVWTDFEVRAYYRPQTDGLTPALVRDGVVELSGGQSLRSQIALRGVFSKTFSKQRAWNLAPEQFIDDPRLADLAVTQLVVDDGWIGVAIGPKRVDSRPAVAHRSAGNLD